MSQVKRCLNFHQSTNVESPQAPVPRPPVQILSDRLYSINGDNEKTNDVIFTGFPDQAKFNVIYFHGDLQNYSELMTTDRDSERFQSEFNLESIGQLLMQRFQEVFRPCHIWIIRACKYVCNKYVVYSNFLSMSNEGYPFFTKPCIPNTVKYVTALPHLSNLLKNAVDRENEILKDRFGSICNSNLPCILIGFSKGCVILTKLLYEIHHEMLINDFSPIVCNIKDMYWLDSSHNGEEEIWPHDYSMFDRIMHCQILKPLCFHAYATPFQIGRPIKLRSCQEFGQLCEILLRLGVQHSSGYLLRGDEINLKTHFDILKAFHIKRK